MIGKMKIGIVTIYQIFLNYHLISFYSSSHFQSVATFLIYNQSLGLQRAAAAAASSIPQRQHARPSSEASAATGGQDRREAAAVVGRRSGLASCVLAALAASFSPFAADRPARALVLDEDDDIELLERVKEDRKKRLEKQGIISASGTETGQSVSEFTFSVNLPALLLMQFFFKFP